MLFLEKYYKGSDLQRVKARLQNAAQNIGCPVDDLDTVIFMESAWKPTAYNEQSGACGLIQWLESTAQDIFKVSAQYIRSLPAYEQLAYVEYYFVINKQRLKVSAIPNKYELYLVVFHPAAVMKPDSYVIGRYPSKAYSGNKSLDANNDGAITKGEVKVWFDNFVKKKTLLRPSSK